MVSVIWSTATRKREESVILQEPIHGNLYLTALPLERQIFIIPHTSSSCSLLSPAPKPAHTSHPTKGQAGGGHLSSPPPLPRVTHCSQNNTEQHRTTSGCSSHLLLCFVLALGVPPPTQAQLSSTKTLTCPTLPGQLRAGGCSEEPWVDGQGRQTPGIMKDMGTHGGSSSLMQIANATVGHQQHNLPRHSQRKPKEISRSPRSSAQKLLHKLQYRKGVELLEQTGPKN